MEQRHATFFRRQPGHSLAVARGQLRLYHSRQQVIVFMAYALTVNEAAAFTGLEAQVVRKEVEYGLFGEKSPPTFKLPALVYLRVFNRLGIGTTVDDRKKIYALIVKAFRRSERPTTVEVSPVLQLKLDVVTAELTDKLERFETWKTKIVTDPDVMGGEPVFPKKRLTVRHIGSMLLRDDRRDAEREIREDYPYLTADDLEFAKLYTLAHPKRGRPRAGNDAPKR